MQNSLKSIYYLLITLLMLLVTLIAYIYPDWNFGTSIYDFTENSYSRIGTITLVIVLFFVFIAINMAIREESKRSLTAIFRALFVIFIILQVFIIFNAHFTPYSDAETVLSESKFLVNNGIRSANTYFDRYPNNIGIVIYQSLLLRIGTLVGINESLIIGFNNILMTSTIVYLISKCLSTNYNRLVPINFLLMCMLFPATYTYLLFLYSDLPATFFLILTLYLIDIYRKKNSWYIAAATGISISLSIWFKTNTVIFLVALLIVTLLHLTQKNYKKAISGLLLMMSFMLLSNLVLGTLESNLGYSRNNSNYKFPMTHFVKMGLNEETEGQFSQSDSNITASLPSYDERKEENIATIKSRIESFDLKSASSFYYKKLRKLTSIGNMENFNLLVQFDRWDNLNSLFSGAKSQFFLNTIAQPIYVFCLLMFTGGITGFKLIKRDYWFDLCSMTVFGVVVFHWILWEVRPRYLYIVLFLILACGSVFLTNFLLRSSFTFKFLKNRKFRLIALLSTLFLVSISFVKFSNIAAKVQYNQMDYSVFQLGKRDRLELATNGTLSQYFEANKEFAYLNIDIDQKTAEGIIKIEMDKKEKNTWVNKYENNYTVQRGEKIIKLVTNDINSPGYYRLNLTPVSGITVAPISGRIIDGNSSTNIYVSGKKYNQTMLAMRVYNVKEQTVSNYKEIFMFCMISSLIVILSFIITERFLVKINE